MRWSSWFTRRRTGKLDRRYVPMCERLEVRTVPATVNLGADLAQAAGNQQALANLNAQGQEFSPPGISIAKADLVVEKRILSDVSTLKKQANTTLQSQIKAAQHQLSANTAALNAAIQQFAQDFFMFLGQGNAAAAQFDLAAITILQQQAMPYVNAYYAQVNAASTQFNATMSSLGNISDAANQAISLDTTITTTKLPT
jgi:hypothetical protein